MMKRVKLIIAVVLIFVAVLCLSLFIFLKTLDVNRFKTQITRQISKSIGRDVGLRHVAFHFSLSGGITLDISGLSVMDHPDFSSDPMLYVDSAHLNIDIFHFIFKRQILVDQVELNSFNVRLIRDSDGEINFQKFTEEAQKQTADPKEAAPAALGVSPGRTGKKKNRDIAFGGMMVYGIRITDGTFVFMDHTITPPVTIPITQIDLRITGLSFHEAFPFEATASLWSGRENIRLNGLAKIDAQNRQVRIDSLTIHTRLSDIVPGRMYAGVPSLKGLGLQDGIDGQLKVDVHQMILGEGGLMVLSSEGGLTGGKMQFNEFPVPIANLDVRFEITDSDVEIKEAVLPLASGQLRMSGRFMEYATDNKFVGDLDLKDIRFDELAAGMNLPVKVEGRLYGSFKGSGEGMTKKALESSLDGEGTIEMKDGRIADMNLLKLVLSKIEFIPNVVEQIEKNIPDKYKEKLKQKDTILDKVSIDTRIRNGILQINRAEVGADGFFVNASGTLDMDQNLRLKADFYIPTDLSDGMVTASKELSYLLDEHKRIHIPFRPYNGKLAKFAMYPDIEDIGKAVMKSRGRKELKKVILDALDLDQKPQAQPSPDGTGQPQPQEPSPEEVIIDDILDLFPILK